MFSNTSPVGNMKLTGNLHFMYIFYSSKEGEMNEEVNDVGSTEKYTKLEQHEPIFVNIGFLLPLT